ncbi:TlpA family protein disulfide reductase [Priestia abyssalis]|uniref:TlpA family protein disulfide reductase n=1 Tax=Priestia abyssalis TaxID=1221450 RepID=UPI000994D81C|nr:TlpA disulfide reductase family protein [Priestia abyssalis]
MKLREQMPELTGATAWINGEITKEQLVGEKATLLHFWSVSCYLCKKAMPDINELRDEYTNHLNVVVVHMSRSEDDLDLNVVEAMAIEHDVIQPIFVDSEHKLANIFENKYVPAYYVFDKEGKLRHFQAGRSGIQKLCKHIERVLNENNQKLIKGTTS